MTIGLFKATTFIDQALATNLIELLDQYGLKKKIAYVKNEGSNLTTMTTTLKSIVKCEVLGLDEIFQGTCFGHVFRVHASMLQLMKSSAKTFGLFLSSLPNHICRNV
jgi:hypothetical protein